MPSIVRIARTGHTAFLLLCVWLCVLLSAPAGAASFRYSAEDTPLKDFLCAFATHAGKNCVVSDAVQGTVSGEFTFANPREFLSFVGRSKSVAAYTDASSMYFGTRAELKSEVIPLGQVGISGLTSALRQMGALDTQYPLRSGYNGMMVMVTAPQPYVDVIRSVADSLLQMAPPAPRATRVFKLKHAFADDITVSLGQSTKTIPGVASMLRRLVGTQDIEGANSTSNQDRSGKVNRRMGQGLSRQTGTQGVIPTQRDMEEQKSGGAGGTGGAGSFGAPVANTGARILADPRLNAVVVWDEEHLMPFYDKIIMELDKSVLLVEIRAAIADVNVSNMRQLGISLDYVTGPARPGKMGVIGGMNTGTGGSPVDFGSTIGQGLNVTTIFTNGIDTLMARIQALEEDGNASVLSRPTVLTSDNVEAVLENTKTFYVEVPGYQTVDLFDVTYGTVLRVTPQIVRQPDGKMLVKLIINIEDGVSTPPTANSGLKLPQVGKTTISTQAMVGDTQALVIGGYYYETKKVAVSGVPFLMNIPLLGYAFKTEEDMVGKQERLFIISPRIVDPQQIPDLPPALSQSFEKTLYPIQPQPRGGCARKVYNVPEAREETPVNPPAARVQPLPSTGQAAGQAAGQGLRPASGQSATR